MKIARNLLRIARPRSEMLKFDASFKYPPAVVIIDFGPDEPEGERRAFYWGSVVRAESMKEV